MYVGCRFVPRLRSLFSLPQLDAQSREWLVVSSHANYQALAKLAASNPRLARFKVGTWLQHSCTDFAVLFVNLIFSVLRSRLKLV